MIYFTSDHHFFHKNIIKYAGRPFYYVEEMNEDIIAKHNSVVTPEDIVYFLGDFAFASIEVQKEILSRLNGKKYLFLGNHDRTEKAMREIGFLDIYKEETWEIEGIKFRLSHYPFAPTDPTTQDVRYLERRPKKEGCDFLLCGHVHEKWSTLENQINVGVDVRNFYPISLEEILTIVNKTR